MDRISALLLESIRKIHPLSYISTSEKTQVEPEFTNQTVEIVKGHFSVYPVVVNINSKYRLDDAPVWYLDVNIQSTNIESGKITTFTAGYDIADKELYKGLSNLIFL